MHSKLVHHRQNKKKCKFCSYDSREEELVKSKIASASVEYFNMTETREKNIGFELDIVLAQGRKSLSVLCEHLLHSN